MSTNSKELVDIIENVITEQKSIFSDITDKDIKEALEQLLTKYI